ncbi:MAG: hypothetical protein AAGF75_14570, partial [Cyanobacteria bacterium P01_H01_bin.130]
MELAQGLKWLIAATVLVGILGFGIGTMVRAYGIPGQQRLLFQEPVLPEVVDCGWAGHPDEIVVSEAVIASNVDRMVVGFKSQDYETATVAIRAILRMRPNWAVMIHNQGLIAANMRQLAIAAELLAKAGEAYLDANQMKGSALVRRHLSAIAEAQA